MSAHWNRRNVLKASAAAGGIYLAGCGKETQYHPAAAAVAANRLPNDNGGPLLVLQLDGGADGLSMVVPARDKSYQRARPTSRLYPEEVLPVHDRRGLHPALETFHRYFQQGQLAIVEGAGYPRPIYSHFRAFEVLHTANPRGRASGNGWIGNLRAAAWPDDPRPELVVHIGKNTPYSVFHDTLGPLSFADPMDFQWTAEPEDVIAMGSTPASEPKGEGDVLSALRRKVVTSTDSAELVRAAVQAHRPGNEYPGTYLGKSLRTVAALLGSEAPARIYSVAHGNFDTHGGTMKNAYWELLKDLDQSLSAFFEDIENTPGAVFPTVLVFTEFGRRVHENRSGGTDHGAAAPMFVFGPRVRGGLYGGHPSLTDLDAEGNLKHQVDFRRVYAGLIRDQFGLDPQGVVGAGFAPLDLLA